MKVFSVFKLSKGRGLFSTCVLKFLGKMANNNNNNRVIYPRPLVRPISLRRFSAQQWRVFNLNNNWETQINVVTSTTTIPQSLSIPMTLPEINSEEQVNIVSSTTTSD